MLRSETPGVPRSLAVIVIARNEERTIEACLRSCVESARTAQEQGLVAQSEILLVNSASTDKTAEIARRLGVRVVSLEATWPLSAAAGRFVGLRETHSDLVLFVDGDFVLDPDWLPMGLDHLRLPNVAAVGGVSVESEKGTTRISALVHDVSEADVPSGDVEDIEVVPVGLYRRSWIEAAGGIQPFLRGAEDRDLALRIREKGGRLLRTRAIMGRHSWIPGEDLNLVEYLRSASRWSYGEGQAARVTGSRRIRGMLIRKNFSARHLTELARGLLTGLWILSAVAAAFSFGPFAAGLFLGGGCLFLLIASWRRKQDVGSYLFRLHQVPYVIVRSLAFGMGYLNPPRPPAEYPVSRRG